MYSSYCFIDVLPKTEANYWLIRAGEKGRLWEQWKEKDIITIGWDIGEDMKKHTKNEIKKKIQENYPSDPGIVQGMLRKFAGTHEDKAISRGNFVIILGDASILGIAEIVDDKPYIYKSEGLITAVVVNNSNSVASSNFDIKFIE